MPLALTEKALIAQHGSNDPIEQFIYPEASVFLDLFNAKSKDIWAEGLGDLYQKLPFDGIQLDMNEVSGLCNGDTSDEGELC